MNVEPPSPRKRELIRRFLKANHTQGEIEGPGFINRLALSEKVGWGTSTITEVFAALRQAYEPHRHLWQAEYEAHANWEFTEEELEQIVDFLESPVGQHFLEGRWRMNAYVETNTEPLVEQVLAEGRELLAKGFSVRGGPAPK